MRRVAQIQSEQSARLLMRVLYGESVETQLDFVDGQYELWVLDDDHLEQARSLADELTQKGPEQFEASHQEQLSQAKTNDRQREKKLKSRASEIIDMRTQAARRSIYDPFVTTTLFALSIIMAFNSNVGYVKTPLVRLAQIVDVEKVEFMKRTYPDGIQEYKARRIMPDGTRSELVEYVPLTEISNGQIWRLVTPIFLHFDIMHILFNLMWVYSMALQIERTQGNWQLLWLTLVFAVVSNLGQYAWGTLFQDYLASVNFGGMSGVVSGYVGYVWIQMKYSPQSRLRIDPQSFAIFLIWTAMCLTGSVGPIANGAHLGGLLIGLLIGGIGPAMHHWNRQQRLKKYRTE